MSEQRESLPCIVCGFRLMRVDPDSEGQPSEGLMLTTYGQYGSTLFDPMNGNYLLVNICDSCMAEAGEKGRVLAGRDSMPVQTETVIRYGEDAKVVKTIVGNVRIGRPYVQWTKNVSTDDGMQFIEIADLVDHWEKWSADHRYQWNLELHHFVAMREEVDALDAAREAPITPTSSGDD